MLFLHYPKCTTCQKAKAYLTEKGVEFEARDIKLENPTAEELRGWWEKSGLPLKKFFNTSGLQYKRGGAAAAFGDGWNAGEASGSGGRGFRCDGLPSGGVG